MPISKLQRRVDVDAIPLSKGKTTTYSDPNADTDPKGIRLAVSSNAKAWIITKRIDGKVKTLRIGAFPEIATVHQAAALAVDMIKPVAIKASAKGSGLRTLNDALEQVLENSSASEITLKAYRDNVRRHLTDLFAKPVDEITLTDIERTLEKHVRRDGGARRATRTYGSLRQIIVMCFDRAEAVRLIPNPTRGLKSPKPMPKRDRVQIDLKKWPVLDMIDKKKQSSRTYLYAFGWELMLFTGLRSINAKTLRWSDIDFDEATMRIEKLKNGRDVTFPLAAHTVEVLRALHKRTGHQQWVFPHRNRAKAGQHIATFGHHLKEGDQRVTPHDMRRLLTTAAEGSGIGPTAVDEMRGDKGRRMASTYNQGILTHAHVEAVARQIILLCGRKADAEVVPLRAVN
ncbi:MAG: tyrosine-type recombinase/integrase [Paracoccaceae bacterium]